MLCQGQVGKRVFTWYHSTMLMYFNWHDNKDFNRRCIEAAMSTSEQEFRRYILQICNDVYASLDTVNKHR